MDKKFNLVFDKVILKKLKKTDNSIRNHISKLFDKLEIVGALAGNLLDAKVNLYELKQLKHAIRIYFLIKGEDIFVLDFELKKSSKKQKINIFKLIKKFSKT